MFITPSPEQSAHGSDRKLKMKIIPLFVPNSRNLNKIRG